MRGNKNNKPKKGFTLLEMVVVIGIFSLLGMVIIDVYLLSLSAQRQTSARQKTLNNIRYVTEVIARQIRASEIDYDHYDNDILSPAAELALIDSEGKSFIYKLDGGEIKLTIDDSQTYSLTNQAELEVVNWNFYISPAFSPFKEEQCRQDIGEIGVGCEVTSGCTVDEPASQFYTGFCQCNSDSDCRLTHNCDLSALDGEVGLCVPVNQQPKVTMALGFKSKGVKKEEEKTINLQTTVSSRYYKR